MRNKKRNIFTTGHNDALLQLQEEEEKCRVVKRFDDDLRKKKQNK